MMIRLLTKLQAIVPIYLVICWLLIVGIISSCAKKDSEIKNVTYDDIVIFSAGKYKGGVTLPGLKQACTDAHAKLDLAHKRPSVSVFISLHERDIKDIPVPEEKPVISNLNKGLTIANTWSDLWDGNVDNPLLSSTSGEQWWSGSTPQGTKSWFASKDLGCGYGRWDISDDTAHGKSGQFNSTDKVWITANPAYSCDQVKHILCVTY